jgi:hypothetical protein
VTIFRLRRDGVACSDLGSEFVILDLDSSVYFSARDSAAVLVGSLQEGASAEVLADRLVARYNVATETAAADVRVFLEQMRSRNLLEQVAS